MGKNAKSRREKIELERKRKKEILSSVYYQKNPWLKFWRRSDFWVYLVCVVLIIAFPFIGAIKASKSNIAIIETIYGNIEVELYASDAPKTVENFKKLSSEGFYDGLLWHRIVKDFVIQGGDPKGDGTGGPGYQFEDELNTHKFVPGTLGMANSGPNTNGSQFFIVTNQEQPSLDGKYTIFGQVTKGMDVVQKIGEAPTGENDKPLTDITMDKVYTK